MGTGSRVLITAALLAVLLVLLAGLWNMLRGKSPNLSQKLMRWRVGLQFLAILLMMTLVYIWRQ
ncbi:MAG TPA: twin transmembrane helix small protein [Hyphomicrobiaceae bacterium]|jgi:membrane-anchored protein YejM (alkaline phosphatase superfamily)|nr:twin transmembrane helix small protein [Hyphomicrobiaceae bacterium]